MKGFYLDFETSKAYRVYNSRTSVVEEIIHVRFNNYMSDMKLLDQEDMSTFNLQELKNNLPKVHDESKVLDNLKEPLNDQEETPDYQYRVAN